MSDYTFHFSKDGHFVFRIETPYKRFAKEVYLLLKEKLPQYKISDLSEIHPITYTTINPYKETD